MEWNVDSGTECGQWNGMWTVEWHVTSGMDGMWTVEQSVGSGMECGQWNGMWMNEQSKNSEKEFK